MSWFDRPEGFIAKSFDSASPVLAERNDIIAHSPRLARLDASAEAATMVFGDEDCDGPEWLDEENQWEPCRVHGIYGCPNDPHAK